MLRVWELVKTLAGFMREKAGKGAWSQTVEDLHVPVQIHSPGSGFEGLIRSSVRDSEETSENFPCLCEKNSDNFP